MVPVALRDWKKPVLWGVVSLVVLVAALDRNVEHVVNTLPKAALGGGLLSVLCAGIALCLGLRFSRRGALGITAVVVAYALAAWYSLKTRGFLGHTVTGESIVPWLLLAVTFSCIFIAASRLSSYGPSVDLALGLLIVVWIGALVTKTSLGLQRSSASLLIGTHAELASAVAAVIGVAILLIAEWLPAPTTNSSVGDSRFLDRSPVLAALLKYPGLTLGWLGMIRIGRREWLRVVLGALALVPLGIGFSEGMVVLGPLLAAFGCWLGWELTAMASAFVAPEGILGILPRSRGSYGRRAAVVSALAACIVVASAVLVAWHESFLAGFGAVVVVALGCGVGFVGAGVAVRVVAADRTLAQSRSMTGIVIVGFAGCALAPLVQLNNAFGAHGLFLEYAITGTSFAIIMGIVGVSLMSWWVGEVRDS